MRAVFAETKGNTFAMGATPAGRMWAALERLMFLFPVLLIGATIFYLPDYLGRYRAQEPQSGLLLVVLIIGTLGLSLLAAVLRFLRKELWVVDLGEQMLVYQTSRLLGGSQQTGVEFEHIKRFAVHLADAPHTSRLVVELDEHGGERMLETRLGAQSLREVAEALAEFLDAHDLDIAVDIPAK